jgi:hypothetical protein
MGSNLLTSQAQNNKLKQTYQDESKQSVMGKRRLHQARSNNAQQW